MDPYERSQIADALKQEIFSSGDYIIKQGESGDKFYFITEGEANAFKKMSEEDKQQEKVYHYKSGDYFGERALLTNDARAASIIVSVSIEKYLSSI
jgi:cAMP-dependent protein kinase regulator